MKLLNQWINFMLHFVDINCKIQFWIAKTWETRGNRIATIGLCSVLQSSIKSCEYQKKKRESSKSRSKSYLKSVQIVQPTTAKLATHDLTFWLAITPFTLTLELKVWGVLKNSWNSLSDRHQHFWIGAKGSWENWVQRYLLGF